MAKKRARKVIRAAIGFHHAYVAAPSQKTVPEAWGSNADLFARGVAERVEDPARMKGALACPGNVVKRPRGAAEQPIAALAPDTPKRAEAEHPKPAAPIRSACVRSRVPAGAISSGPSRRLNRRSGGKPTRGRKSITGSTDCKASGAGSPERHETEKATLEAPARGAQVF